MSSIVDEYTNHYTKSVFIILALVLMISVTIHTPGNIVSKLYFFINYSELLSDSLFRLSEEDPECNYVELLF
jgi:hypothetical protein